MALKPGDRIDFENLLKAAKEGRLALMECKNKETGEYVAVACFVNGEDNGDVSFVPVAKLFGDNPYDEVLPPEQEDGSR